MTGVITRRCPDDAGYLLLDSRDGAFQIGQNGFEPRPCDVCLGNRRLSIIFLSSNGRQPIANETGDIFAVRDLGSTPIQNSHIERWRRSYNTDRPHQALHALTPAEFARTFSSPTARCSA